MDFAKRVKEIREKLKMSQETLARELGLSFATINRLETGKSKPCYDTIKKFEEFCSQKGLKV